MDQRLLLPRLIVLMGCIASIFLLTYVHYNQPIFKQIFAHYFYKTVDASKPKSDFSCINANVARASSFFDRNEHIFLGGAIGSDRFEYQVDNKKYIGSGYSYLRDIMGCQQIISQVAYFPIFPNWSIADNSFPSGRYWDNFVQSTITILSILLIYGVIWIGAYFCKNQIISNIQKDEKFSLLILSVFLPFIIIIICSIFPIFDVLNEIHRTLKSLYRNFFRDYLEIGLGIAFYLCAYLPSSIIFIQSFKGHKLRYLYAVIFMIGLWWFWMVIMSRFTASSILLV